MENRPPAPRRSKMIDTSQPSDLARETLRQLALRKIAPTPDNYRALYHEIAGTQAEDGFPDRMLRQIGAALPRHSRDAVRFAQAFEDATARQDWQAVKTSLTEAFTALDVPELNWPALLRELITEWDRRQAGLTQARKREMLDRVLSASGAHPERLHERLQALVRAWARNSDDDSTDSTAATESGEVRAQAERMTSDTPVPADSSGVELLQRLLTGLEAVVVHLDPEAAHELQAIAAHLQPGAPSAPVGELRTRLDRLLSHLNWVAEDHAALRDALLRVLKLIVDNISKLVMDDQWLRGQMSLLDEVFSHPLDIRTLGELESRLRDVIARQAALKHELSDAHAKLKDMLARFVDRLGEFSDSTGDYHDKIEQCAGRISTARDISELTDVIAEVMKETRSIQESTLRSRTELEELRGRVENANVEINRLQNELEQTSELVRHDPLTGTLNRKGLDDAFARETALARRRNTRLCVALLDVDNFKHINDTHGHQTGDEALQHLASVIRENLRPQDSVARYGGEEFVILLPDTDVDLATATLVRLQRALTKRYFLARQQKLLITFSAGVAELQADEDTESALDRADKAMYIAKRSGKNRVISAT